FADRILVLIDNVDIPYVALILLPEGPSQAKVKKLDTEAKFNGVSSGERRRRDVVFDPDRSIDGKFNISLPLVSGRTHVLNVIGGRVLQHSPVPRPYKRIMLY